MKLTTKDTKTSKKLLYTSVYDKLYKMIIDGEYPLNSKLPSEPELAKSFGVSRMTLRQALALLQDDGLVKNIRGKGKSSAKSGCMQSQRPHNLFSVSISAVSHISWLNPVSFNNPSLYLMLSL